MRKFSFFIFLILFCSFVYSQKIETLPYDEKQLDLDSKLVLVQDPKISLTEFKLVDEKLTFNVTSETKITFKQDYTKATSIFDLGWNHIGDNPAQRYSAILEFPYPVENDNGNYICPIDLPKNYGVKQGTCLYIEPQIYNYSGELVNERRIDILKGGYAVNYSWLGSLDPIPSTVTLVFFVPFNETTGTGRRDYGGAIRNDVNFTSTSIIGWVNQSTKIMLNVNGTYSANEMAALNFTEVDINQTQDATWSGYVNLRYINTSYTPYIFRMFGADEQITLRANASGYLLVNIWGREKTTPIDLGNKGMHLVISFDNANDKIFIWVNGTRNTSIAGFDLDQTYNVTQSIRIGHRDWDNPNYFNGTLGYFRVYNNLNATDLQANAIFSNDINYTQLPAGDSTPPIISAINISQIGNTTATLNFTTDEGANATINYGTATTLGTLLTNVSMITQHTFSFTGLTNNTLYYYNISSCDSSLNCRNNGTNNFTTTQTVQYPIVQNSTFVTITIDLEEANNMFLEAIILSIFLLSTYCFYDSAGKRLAQKSYFWVTLSTISSIYLSFLFSGNFVQSLFWFVPVANAFVVLYIVSQQNK